MTPAGRYRAVIKDVQLTTNKKGNPELDYSLSIIGKYDGDQLYEPEGGVITRTVFAVITDNTAERRARELQTIEPTVTDFSQVDQRIAGDTFIDIREREIDVTCSHSRYNDKDKENWDFDMRAGGTYQTAVPEAKIVREIQAKFKRYFQPVAQAAGPLNPETPF